MANSTARLRRAHSRPRIVGVLIIVNIFLPIVVICCKINVVVISVVLVADCCRCRCLVVEA